MTATTPALRAGSTAEPTTTAPAAAHSTAPSPAVSLPAQRSRGRRRLVVVGNGMAGARAVEEVLARGGAEQFSVTMFGDEPYGNYNRILLSHVLSGEE